MRKKMHAGTIIGGKYRIVGFLRKGATGSVWEAESLEFKNRHCAIKFFDPKSSVGKKEDLLSRFINEASLLEDLSRKSDLFVRVYDLKRSTGTCPPYFVMDCIKNKVGKIQTLEDVRGDKDEFGEENLAKWFIDVACAVQQLHRLNIVHRDIKPSNILINEAGRAILVDFGVVKVSEQCSKKLGLRTPKYDDSLLVYGTRPFLAPELIQGTEKASAASDVYALAGTFFQLVCNKDPETSIDYTQCLNSCEDKRWSIVLPKMLSPTPSNRMNIDDCLSEFRAVGTNGFAQENGIDHIETQKQGMKDCEIHYNKEEELSRVRDLMHKLYSKLVLLDWRDRGQRHCKEDVIKAMYDKYREQELRILKKIYSEDPSDANIERLTSKLHALDEQFMCDFNASGLVQMSDVLVEVLNLNLWEILVNGDKQTRDDNLLEKCIVVIKTPLSAFAQFVFGKYRHHQWKLEQKFKDGKIPKDYRGEFLADRLFMYERTLLLYVPSKSVLEKLLSDIERRNDKESLNEKGIALDLAGIWHRKFHDKL